MATRNATVEWIGKRTAKITWTGLLDAGTDAGDGQDVSRFSQVNIQVKGTFDTAASLSIEGSADAGSTYNILNDSRGEGNPMTFTGTDTRKLNELPNLIRPRVTAGSGGSNLTVIAICSVSK